jgi:hypothetical protein
LGEQIADRDPKLKAQLTEFNILKQQFLKTKIGSNEAILEAYEIIKEQFMKNDDYRHHLNQREKLISWLDHFKNIQKSADPHHRLNFLFAQIRNPHLESNNEIAALKSSGRVLSKAKSANIREKIASPKKEGKSSKRSKRKTKGQTAEEEPNQQGAELLDIRPNYMVRPAQTAEEEHNQKGAKLLGTRPNYMVRPAQTKKSREDASFEEKESVAASGYMVRPSEGKSKESNQNVKPMFAGILDHPLTAQYLSIAPKVSALSLDVQNQLIAFQKGDAENKSDSPMPIVQTHLNLQMLGNISFDPEYLALSNPTLDEHSQNFLGLCYQDTSFMKALLNFYKNKRQENIANPNCISFAMLSCTADDAPKNILIIATSRPMISMHDKNDAQSSDKTLIQQLNKIAACYQEFFDPSDLFIFVASHTSFSFNQQLYQACINRGINQKEIKTVPCSEKFLMWAIVQCYLSWGEQLQLSAVVNYEFFPFEKAQESIAHNLQLYGDCINLEALSKLPEEAKDEETRAGRAVENQRNAVEELLSNISITKCLCSNCMKLKSDYVAAALHAMQKGQQNNAHDNLTPGGRARVRSPSETECTLFPKFKLAKYLAQKQQDHELQLQEEKSPVSPYHALNIASTTGRRHSLFTFEPPLPTHRAAIANEKIFLCASMPERARSLNRTLVKK